MKLVDILARELDRWPEGMSETVGQGHTGYLHGYAGNGHPNCQATRQIFTMCNDYGTEKVTRDEWQAAVDALKADVRPTESMALHHQEVGRITRQWAGEGMPPAGIDVEVLHSGHEQWAVRHINYIGGTKGIVVFRGDVDAELACPVISCQFRPIRGPEQIATEERQGAIHEMVDHLKRWSSVQEMCGQLYDAGYRKLEIGELK